MLLLTGLGLVAGIALAASAGAQASEVVSCPSGYTELPGACKSLSVVPGDYEPPGPPRLETTYACPEAYTPHNVSADGVIGSCLADAINNHTECPYPGIPTAITSDGFVQGCRADVIITQEWVPASPAKCNGVEMGEGESGCTSFGPEYIPLVRTRYCSRVLVTVDLTKGDLPTNGNDVIWGGSTADTVDALAGDDLICTGDGNDIVLGGPGNDKIWAGNGDDKVYGNEGSDVLRGDAGNDIIFGDTGRDRIFGGEGNDTIRGGSLADRIYGGPGNDKIYGEQGRDTIFGHGGDDELYGGGFNDRLFGGAGNDSLYGSFGADSLAGGSGRDLLVGGPGIDDCGIVDSVDTARPSCESGT